MIVQVESVFWVLSVFDESQYAKGSAFYTAIFLGFDCVSFLAMMALFRGDVFGVKEC